MAHTYTWRERVPPRPREGQRPTHDRETFLQCYYWENGWLFSPLTSVSMSWGAVGHPTWWWRLNDAHSHPSHPRHHPHLPRGPSHRPFAQGTGTVFELGFEGFRAHTLSCALLAPKNISIPPVKTWGFLTKKKNFLPMIFLLHVFNINGKTFLQNTQPSPADEGSLDSWEKS